MEAVMLNTDQMAKLTLGLDTKSGKMRVLAKAGYSRGDIARFLGTSYQFVRNVLVREEGRAIAAKSDTPDGPSNLANPNPNRVRLGAAGQITIPEAILTALGLKEGNSLIATIEDEEIRLMTIPAAIRKAQAIVRQYVPEGVSLVDELLEDRRREVERENRE
jgi:bifunctional DNA-binding transcriptional regulator/antitoxin component of YhaV-PrlF toxin-antitoxin module